MKIIIAGYGFVGKAVYQGLHSDHQVVIVDPKYTTNEIQYHHDADGIIICVNTPTSENGIVVEHVADVLDQVPPGMPVLIKSTVTPSVVDLFSELYSSHSICYSPEFLRAASATTDFINQKYVVIGGDDTKSLWHNLFVNTLPDCKIVFHCSSKEACLVKYTANSFLALKVAYFNQIYDLCNATDMDYDAVKHIVTQDIRIGSSHTVIPGLDGTRGFGGDCFPKDTEAFVHWAKHYDVVPTLVESAIQYNNKVRKNS